MKSRAPWNKYPFLRHAVIHFPPLRGEEAHEVICFLEEVIRAIWHAHGDALADYRAMMDIETPQPSDSQSTWPKKSDDITF